MIWPNEFAMWAIGVLGVTGEMMVGVTTLASIIVYFAFLIAVPVGVGGWFLTRNDRDEDNAA